jgi:type 1 fimbria pilin
MKKSIWIAMAACAVLTIVTAGHLQSAAAQKAAVSTAGGVITLKGTETQTSPTIKISEGVYVVQIGRAHV